MVPLAVAAPSGDRARGPGGAGLPLLLEALELPLLPALPLLLPALPLLLLLPALPEVEPLPEALPLPPTASRGPPVLPDPDPDPEDDDEAASGAPASRTAAVGSGRCERR